MNTAIFDIGKTNKKFLVFDNKLNVVHEVERDFDEISDNDGFPCDDLDAISNWISETIGSAIINHKLDIRKLNFSTYGASLVHLDQNGKRVGDFINYLKPIDEAIYFTVVEKHGGVERFSVKTASPIMGLLNSGFQLPFLKATQPDIYSKVKNVLHFPQYLSYLFTNKLTSDISSIGCHTAMWDFEENTYHEWLKEFKVIIPLPLPNHQTFQCSIQGRMINVGIGMHDSSASLVPYIQNASEPFILISTGTWCVNMNPFNNDLLTAEELSQDCLCYISHLQKQVKSSRFFMGHYHDKLNEQLCNIYHTDNKAYKAIKLNPAFLKGNAKLIKDLNNLQLTTCNLNRTSYDEAYHLLMKELTDIEIEKIKLVIPKVDNTKKLIVTGGFIYNEIFIHLLRKAFPDKAIEVSALKNASALGAAIVLSS